MKKLILLTVIASFAMSTVMAQNIRYVKQNGNGNGSSWENASSDIQTMMNELKSTGGEVWVAKGTYVPLHNAADDSIGDGGMDNAFVLIRDVKLYGGFLGTETELDSRDYKINKTILSGKINDTTDACHVVISSDSVGSACIDGFIITGGNATTTKNIKVNKKTIARNNGGGVHISSSSPVLRNLIITENNANFAGGIYCASSSEPEIIDVVISKNNAVAGGGGGITNSSSPSRLTNVIISQNTATAGGGGMNNTSSKPILTNVVIVENTAKDGGAINNSSSSPILTNLTIANNSATGKSGGINNSATAAPLIRNTIIWGNTADDTIPNINFAKSVFENSLLDTSGSADVFTPGIISTADPLFKSNYSLKKESPAIDKGNNVFYNADSIPNLSEIATDIKGNNRIYNEIIDLGAYEYSGKNYSITLPEITGISISIIGEYSEIEANKFEVEEYNDFSFTITKDSVYSQCTPVVTLNQEADTLFAIEELYTITEIEEDIIVNISGIERNPVSILSPNENTAITHKIIDGYLYVENNLTPISTIRLYDVNGKLVGESTSDRIKLPRRGFYIAMAQSEEGVSVFKILW